MAIKESPAIAAPLAANAALSFRTDGESITRRGSLSFPVRVFKEIDLLSIDKKNVFKIMTSSGTTGQRPSKIFIDKETAWEIQNAGVNAVDILVEEKVVRVVGNKRVDLTCYVD